MVAGGSALDGMIGGQIAHATTNWRWIFWMDVILTRICLLVTTLFQAETNFKRLPSMKPVTVWNDLDWQTSGEM